MVNHPPKMMNRLAALLSENGARLFAEVAVNFVLPFVIYKFAEAPLGPVRALLASSTPPLLWSLVEFARNRRIDALSLLALGGIALSLLAMLGGGGVRMLQLREKFVTAAIGFAFVGSTLVGKPLVYELARASKWRESENEAKQFEALQVHAAFRRTMTIMTLMWGIGLLAEFTVSVLLMFVLSIPAYLIVGPIIGYGTMGLLTLVSFLYGRRAKRRGEARRAAALAEAASTPLAAG